jgi:glycosyltransferase involved in cell wall biosynthesis
MKIVMLSWEYPPRIVGGISPHVYEISQELTRLGVEIHVVTQAVLRTPHEEIEPSGVHVYRVDVQERSNNFLHEIQLLNASLYQRTHDLLKQWHPTHEPVLIHAHDWLSLEAARRLKYDFQIPMIATVHATERGRHGGIHNDTQKYIHTQEYWLTWEAWRVIVCSYYIRQEIMDSFHCPSDKIDVIYNGVDPKKFEVSWSQEERQAWRNQFATPEEKIIMYVGRFVREKGIHILLNAAGTILAKFPSAKFVIVGGGYREHYEKFVRWFGIEEKVLFTGFVSTESLYKLYKVADVAAFPSLYEPFGIVALEAMAAGIPVVTSDAGGLREVVLHEQTGTLSYAGDPQSLAWAILHVLQNPEKAKQWALHATERLHKDFNWAKLSKQTLEVYERVWDEYTHSKWGQTSFWLCPQNSPQQPTPNEQNYAQWQCQIATLSVEPEALRQDILVS